MSIYGSVFALWEKALVSHESHEARNEEGCAYSGIILCDKQVGSQNDPSDRDSRDDHVPGRFVVQPFLPELMVTFALFIFGVERFFEAL